MALFAGEIFAPYGIGPPRSSVLGLSEGRVNVLENLRCPSCPVNAQLNRKQQFGGYDRKRCFLRRQPKKSRLDLERRAGFVRWTWIRLVYLAVALAMFE